MQEKNEHKNSRHFCRLFLFAMPMTFAVCSTCVAGRCGAIFVRMAGFATLLTDLSLGPAVVTAIVA